MKVMITTCEDPFWYKDHIGEVFLVEIDPKFNEYYLTVDPIYKKHQGHIKKVECIEVWDVLPQAINATEPHNEVEAEGGS